jgi:hypothetical protein
VLLQPGEHWVRVTPILTEEEHRRGTLYLTNRRLVLEIDTSTRVLDRLSGAVRPRTAFDVAPFEVHNAHLVRKLFGGTVLQLDVRGATYFLVTPEARLWVEHLARERASVPPVPPPPPPPPPPGGAPTPHVIQTIERQVVKVRCHHCGQLADEVLGRCPSCAAPL